VLHSLAWYVLSLQLVENPSFYLSEFCSHWRNEPLVLPQHVLTPASYNGRLYSPKVLRVSTSPGWHLKVFFLLVMKLSHRLSERQKQDDKTACNSRSKTLRADTVWESTEICHFSEPKSMLDLPFCYCKVMVHGHTSFLRKTQCK